MEELVDEHVARGVDQVVLLGAGLDTLALRRVDLRDRVEVFEVDEPSTQRWKQQRIDQLFGSPPANVRFVPVDFESGASWRGALVDVGFATDRPSLVLSTGVTQYITEQALAATLTEAASLPVGSTVVLTFIIPAESTASIDRELRAVTEQRAAERGAPWISCYDPDDVMGMVRAASFSTVDHVSPTSWHQSGSRPVPTVFARPPSSTPSSPPADAPSTPPSGANSMSQRVLGPLEADAPCGDSGVGKSVYGTPVERGARPGSESPTDRHGFFKFA